MVTGAAGFIGARLTQRLLSEGHEVHALDILPRDQARRLKDSFEHPNFRYSSGDLCDRRVLEEFYRTDASHLYHLASIVGVTAYMRDPLLLIDSVIGSTRNLLELAQKHGTRVLFTSTSEIYGKNPEVPWREDADRVLGPPSVDRWSYSTSKAICEHILFAMGRHGGLTFSTVRFFNVYGPGQSPNFVVSKSIYNALRGERPLLYDGGKQTRCFTYVDDAIEGVVRASRDPRAQGEAFNIGSDTEHSMRNLIRIVIEEAASTLEPLPFDTHAEFGSVYEDIPRRVPSVEKARAMLDWRAETDLRSGIRSTINWARHNPWWLADL